MQVSLLYFGGSEKMAKGQTCLLSLGAGEGAELVPYTFVALIVTVLCVNLYKSISGNATHGK